MNMPQSRSGNLARTKWLVEFSGESSTKTAWKLAVIICGFVLFARLLSVVGPSYGRHGPCPFRNRRSSVMRTHGQLVYTRNFSEIGIKDINRVGGKNASLGELFNSLK